jgi:hypothetical protein
MDNGLSHWHSELQAGLFLFCPYRLWDSPAAAEAIGDGEHREGEQQTAGYGDERISNHGKTPDRPPNALLPSRPTSIEPQRFNRSALIVTGSVSPSSYQMKKQAKQIPARR